MCSGARWTAAIRRSRSSIGTTPRAALGLSGAYDVSPLDGRFLTEMRDKSESAPNQIFVVLNWHSELIERLR